MFYNTIAHERPFFACKQQFYRFLAIAKKYHDLYYSADRPVLQRTSRSGLRARNSFQLEGPRATAGLPVS